jgi:hypothetical protein
MLLPECPPAALAPPVHCTVAPTYTQACMPIPADDVPMMRRRPAVAATPNPPAAPGGLQCRVSADCDPLPQSCNLRTLHAARLSSSFTERRPQRAPPRRFTVAAAARSRAPSSMASRGGSVCWRLLGDAGTCSNRGVAGALSGSGAAVARLRCASSTLTTGPAAGSFHDTSTAGSLFGGSDGSAEMLGPGPLAGVARSANAGR